MKRINHLPVLHLCGFELAIADKRWSKKTEMSLWQMIEFQLQRTCCWMFFEDGKAAARCAVRLPPLPRLPRCDPVRFFDALSLSSAPRCCCVRRDDVPGCRAMARLYSSAATANVEEGLHWVGFTSCLSSVVAVCSGLDGWP